MRTVADGICPNAEAPANPPDAPAALVARLRQELAVKFVAISDQLREIGHGDIAEQVNLLYAEAIDHSAAEAEAALAALGVPRQGER